MPQTRQKITHKGYAHRSNTGHTMLCMDDLLHQALAAEIRARLAGKNDGVTAKAAQQAVGVSSSAWQSYFKTRSRDVPTSVLVRIADFLEMPLWRLLYNAEQRAAAMDPHQQAAERALASLPPDLAEEVRRVDREQRDAREDDSPVTVRPTGVGRSATTGS